MGTGTPVTLDLLEATSKQNGRIVNSCLADQRAEAQAKDRLGAHPFTKQLETEVYQKWVEWGDWIGTKYQRTYKAVEGRNGYLSRLHHTSRGGVAQLRDDKGC